MIASKSVHVKTIIIGIKLLLYYLSYIKSEAM